MFQIVSFIPSVILMAEEATVLGISSMRWVAVMAAFTGFDSRKFHIGNIGIHDTSLVLAAAPNGR